MTEQEKQLLLKDLCARLPHKQKVCYKIHDNSEEITETLSGLLLDYFKTGKIAVVKPYLRPMSSMTNEENTWADADYSYNKLTYGINYAIVCYVDYLYSIHVDCHGLIPKGLAFEAPEGMYNI